MFGWLRRVIGSPPPPIADAPRKSADYSRLAVQMSVVGPEPTPYTVERKPVPRGPSHSEFPVSMEAEITYVDIGGRETRRRITTLGVSRHVTAGWSVESYCHLRGDVRTFVTAGITEFTDLSTGEIVSDLNERFTALYRETPAGIVDTAIEQLGPEINGLVYIARRGSRLTVAKRDTITDYVLARFGDERLDPGLLRERIREWQDDERFYRSGLRKAAKALDQEQRGKLLELLPTLASKKDDPFTVAALSLAEKSLRKTEKQRPRRANADKLHHP